MPYPFLLPEEVSAADAKQVLDFLNGAESAEQIDAAIEIPQQPDIGPMLALRLFRRRQELGQFTSLNQIYAIPYIGPQRFTQIVVSLSSARPPINPQPNTALLDLLSERIALLEQRLNPQPSIRLRAINPEALLGQESILLAEVLAADGRPLIDQPVTFVTTWGVLRGRHGLQPVAGTSINVRSDHLGLCKVRLRAAAGENLSVTELDNLTQALTLLGSAAGSPRDNLQGLTELVRQYRAAGNSMLRSAIDTLAKRYADSALQEAPVDSLASWPRIQVSIFALLPPDPEGVSTAAPSSMINLQQRNWFYAWLWAFRQLLESESQLGASLADVGTGERSGRGILSDLYNRVDSFVSTQPGVIGRQLGERFAADRLNSFLSEGLKGVKTEERARVLMGVSSGAGALKSAQSFGALSSSRAEAQMDVDAGVSKVGGNLDFGLLDSRLNQLEQSAVKRDELSGFRDSILRAAATNVTTQITDLRSEFNGQLQSKADLSALAELGANFELQLNDKADVSQFQDLQSALTTGLAGKANIADVKNLQKEFNTKLATKADTSQITALQNQLNDKADVSQIQSLQNALTNGLASKADATRVTTLENQLNNKADRSAVTDLSASVDARLATKADATTVANLDRQVSALDTRTQSINTNLTNLNGQVTNINTLVNRLRPVGPIR